MTDINPPFTNEDLQFLEHYGLRAEEARRQWALLTHRPRPIELVRPCTTGDGIRQLAPSEQQALMAVHRQSADDGRWLKFVPASGAASRMFALDSDDEKRQFCESFERFAFADRARERLVPQGVQLSHLRQALRHDELIDAVVSPAGLDYGRLPKGLVEFHAYPDTSRTAFEEHLREALACLGDRDGATRFHFTVTAEHRDQFVDHLRQFTSRLTDASCQMDFSIQHPSTDTIAMTDRGELLRSEQGQPVLRPGGHGALLENLNALQGDLIFVKNIDNVGHEHVREASIAWMQILGGHLARLQEAVCQHLRSLQAGDDGCLAGAVEFVQSNFPSATLPDSGGSQALRGALHSRLHRPLRVCGMVRNQGEPGGGPFWVREADKGLTLQIVEAAEVDPHDSGQQTILQQATHFNPVFMALSVRDEDGAAFELRKFVDDQRAIITQKPIAGQAATVLERPGLWNGAMAGWNSVFVEVPMAVFSPVKTVCDLLRPEHQPPGRLPSPEDR